MPYPSGDNDAFACNPETYPGLLEEDGSFSHIERDTLVAELAGAGLEFSQRCAKLSSAEGSSGFAQVARRQPFPTTCKPPN